MSAGEAALTQPPSLERTNPRRANRRERRPKVRYPAPWRSPRPRAGACPRYEASQGFLSREQYREGPRRPYSWARPRSATFSRLSSRCGIWTSQSSRPRWLRRTSWLHAPKLEARHHPKTIHEILEIRLIVEKPAVEGIGKGRRDRDGARQRDGGRRNRGVRGGRERGQLGHRRAADPTAGAGEINSIASGAGIRACARWVLDADQKGWNAGRRPGRRD